MGLRRIAALVGIAAEKNEVNIIVQGVCHYLVEGGEKIVEAPREPGIGVIASTIVLYPKMQVGEVKYSHRITTPGALTAPQSDPDPAR